MKKILAFVLIIIMVFSTSLSVFAADTSVSAKYNGMTKDELQNEFLKNIKKIEKYIESQDTTVLNELYKEKNKLENILASETDIGEKEKLENLIQNYTEIISKYENYQRNKDASTDDITIQGVYDPVL